MITEDYVSFETAKLLKEKGFDSDEVGCHGGFYSERCYEHGCGIKTQSGQEVGIVYDDLTNSNLEHDEYLRPTLQMAMKWLREVHNLFIEIKYATSLFSQPHTTIYFQICYMSLDYNTSGKNMLPDDYIREDYTSYEEACEAAIKYCLENLI